MPYFTEKQVKRVTLPSNQDYWVDISTQLTWKQAKQFRAEEDTDKMIVATEMLLISLIKEWNLDNDDGTIATVNQESIDRLPKEDVDELIDAITDVISNSEKTSQKKSLSKESPKPLTEEVTPPSN